LPIYNVDGAGDRPLYVGGFIRFGLIHTLIAARHQKPEQNQPIAVTARSVCSRY